jgi:hypothetical protein
VLWTVFRFIEQQKNDYETTFIIDLKKDFEAEMYMNIILDLIEDQKSLSSRIKLEGILKLHISKIDANNKDNKKILLEIYNRKFFSHKIWLY